MDPNRIAAAKAGAKTYAGKPCKKDQTTERYVSTGQCRECEVSKSKRVYADNKALLDAARKAGAAAAAKPSRSARG